MAFVATSTANPLGQRPLNFMLRNQSPPVYAGLLGWIGQAATPGDYDTNTQVLGALVSMGAISPDESAQIDAGTLSLDDLPVTMTMINEALSETGQTGAQTVLPLPTTAPASITPLTPLATSTPAPPAGTPQVASGTPLVYTATWSSQFAAPANAQVIGWTASTAVAAIRAALASQNIVIDSFSGSGGTLSASSGYSLNLSVHTTGAFNQLSDVKAIIDHAIYSQVSGTMPTSSISGVVLGSQLPQAPTTLTSWFEQNAGTIAIFVAVIVFGSVALRRL